MLNIIHKLIDRLTRNSIRRTVLDWPLDFGLETAVLNNVRGDYHEFGVFKGRSFIRNAKAFAAQLSNDEYAAMNFWAYDSFEGLPETHDKFAPDHFTKGSFSASRETFMGNVRQAGVSEKQIKIVPGFYDKSLTETQAAESFATRKVAMTYIDCDIYESAVPIFEFLTHGLQVGTVIVIDDWVRHHCHPDHGIQKAFNEWLKKNPSIKVTQIALTKRVAFVVYEI